ncbi:hypothetical protein [Chlamydiifrater phoenicopteri]|uniref:hypothetical protein n=1 Tax=Chlamydiifrater phoenicopteri TaxID=2681469 RepID=UPI001BD1605C|nr:hypothetical protein [Chlamydiifrater phoenicopteri]
MASSVPISTKTGTTETITTTIVSPKTLSSKARNLSLLASLVSVVTIALLSFGLFVAATVATQTMALICAMVLSVVLLGLSIASLLASQKARSLLIERNKS